jgi:hypothetical protein
MPSSRPPPLSVTTTTTTTTTSSAPSAQSTPSTLKLSSTLRDAMRELASTASFASKVFEGSKSPTAFAVASILETIEQCLYDLEATASDLPYLTQEAATRHLVDEADGGDGAQQANWIISFMPIFEGPNAGAIMCMFRSLDGKHTRMASPPGGPAVLWKVDESDDYCLYWKARNCIDETQKLLKRVSRVKGKAEA